jgi:hypothetical protein
MILSKNILSKLIFPEVFFFINVPTDISAEEEVLNVK